MDSSSSTLSSLAALASTLGASAGQMMVAVQAFAYAASIFFLTMGIVMMTKAANPSARNSYTNGSGWFWSIAVGVVMFSLPEAMSVVGSTFFPESNTSPLAYQSYVQGSNMAAGSCTLGGLRPLFVLFGFIAFIRGLIVLRTVALHGSHSRANASVARGFILLVAGIALVHMQDLLAGINKLTGLNLGAGLC